MIIRKEVLGEEIEIFTDCYINGEEYYRCVTFPYSGTFSTLDECIMAISDIIKSRLEVPI